MEGGRDWKRHLETFGDNRNVHYLDYNDGFTGCGLYVKIGQLYKV